MKRFLLLALLAAPLIAQQDRPVRFFPTNPVNPCSVITPLVNNWSSGFLWNCVGAPGVNNGTWNQLWPPAAPSVFNGPNDSRQFNFTAQTPGGTLTGGIAATVHLLPCPLGVGGADTFHPLYISGGTGTAEAVKITGGTCVSQGANGTVVFTPANTHTGAWTIQSATSGIREAILAFSSVGSVTVQCGAWPIYGSLLIPRTVEVFGQGPCTDLQWKGSTAGAAIISADNATTDSLEYLSGVTNLKISNQVAVGTTIGVLAGGDPAAVLAPSTLLGGRVAFRHVWIVGFNTDLFYGSNAYNRTWEDVRFDGLNAGHYGVRFGISGSGFGGNSGTYESFIDVKWIGFLTAAIELNAPVGAAFINNRCEYNKRCFYFNEVSGIGSDITWVGGHMETFSDNVASTHCAVIDLCGPFMDDESLVSSAVTLIGGDYFYSDGAVAATSYFNFSNCFRLTFRAVGIALGSASGATVTNVITVASTDPANSTVNITTNAYAEGFAPTITNYVNTFSSMSPLTNFSVETPNGKKCFACANPNTAAVTTFGRLALCTASNQGLQVEVSDSTTQVWGATAAGGGGSTALLHCDGANWTVIGK